jgi:hypothetical protein
MFKAIQSCEIEDPRIQFKFGARQGTRSINDYQKLQVFHNKLT